jgi:hypothetical protein
VEHRRWRRGHAAQRQDRAEPETGEDRQIEAAAVLGDVRQRVRARVAIRVRVRQGADPAGIDHDDERAACG